MRARALFAAAILTAAALGPAIADDDEACDARIGDWQPRSAVVKMAESRGWTVRRIKTDDGCYEIRCTDKDGRSFIATVDPATLDVLSTRDLRSERGEHEGRAEPGGHDGVSGHDDDDDDGEDGGRAAPQPNAAAPGTTVPDNGLFKGKQRPKVQVQ